MVILLVLHKIQLQIKKSRVRKNLGFTKELFFNVVTLKMFYKIVSSQISGFDVSLR